MKKILLFSLISTFIFSQEKVSTDSLMMMIIDSLKINQQLLMNQQKMLENQEEILGEVKYKDPLIGKFFGLEINPIGLLLSSAGSEGFSVRAGISFFPDSLHGEITFPIYYRENSGTLFDDYVFQIDGQYRKFIGKHRKGFYFSSGVRYLYREKSYIPELDDSNSSTNDIGVTFGIGFRLYGTTGWYWGTGLYGGRYFSGDDRGILELELLKFGMYF